jgi:multiple antibiotic resistance protein
VEQFSFIFTALFMLLGPVKLIHSFAELTHGADIRFKRAVAIRGAVIASTLCAFVVLAGTTLLGKYRINIDAVRIAGGLILLISALMVIFKNVHPSSPDAGNPSPIQVAITPVAVPIIVPHAGVAVVLMFLLQAPQYPGLTQTVVICLAIMMVLDFLAMHFIDQIMRTPGLTIILTVLGSVLVFVQASLAIQMIMVGLKSLPALLSDHNGV